MDAPIHPDSMNVGDLILIEDAFYGTKISSYHKENGAVQVRFTVFRKDTGEPVGGSQAISRDVSTAQEQARKRLERLSAALPRPPDEWGDVAVRNVLILFKNYEDQRTALNIALQRKHATGTMTQADLQNAHHETCELIRKQTVALVAGIQALSDAQKLQLLQSPERMYRNPSDAYSLDDLTARDALFAYLINPSPEMADAHATHQKRWHKAIDATGRHSDATQS
jgi:hypothetical protein